MTFAIWDIDNVMHDMGFDVIADLHLSYLSENKRVWHKCRASPG